jgi:phosphoribosylanthranilate isomerase
MLTLMWIKICANTNLADAQFATELGASAVGFFFAPSKRQVSPAQVGAITAALPPSVEKIGVFPVSTAAEIIEAVEIAGLTGVQLHGDPNPELITSLHAAFGGSIRLIQVVGFAAGSAVGGDAESSFRAALRLACSQPGLDAVLLDAAKDGISGGLGIAFDWSRAAAVVEQIFAGQPTRLKLIVAGGLKSENVRQAIAVFHPYGVDVASGVEMAGEPGKKDPSRLREFLAAARGSSYGRDDS